MITEQQVIAPTVTKLSTPADVSAHQLAVALEWVRRGIPVIPASRRDKGPMVNGFGRDATPEQLARFSNPEQVRSWWSGKFARAHVGILTRSLVVIDLDKRKPGAPAPDLKWAACSHGNEVLDRLRQDAGADWPETYTVSTPSGGTHLYFLQPDGEPVGCATGAGPSAPALGPYVDVRGVGGLVIAAGSYSAVQGRAYERISPAGVPPQPLPAWLLALLRRPDEPRPAPAPVQQLPTGGRAERYATAALNGEVEKVTASGPGARWRALTAAAARLAELSHTAPGVLNETAATSALLAAARASGTKERDSRLRTIIESAWAMGLRGGAR